MKRILNIVGARPNFMKIAPIQREMQNHGSQFEPVLVHTGQHYDKRMSKLFFDDLQLPKPDFYLGVGSGSHAQQTAKIMIEFEKICQELRPDLIIVVGDVNSTAACSMVASKLWIPIAHVEAGLRSFDRRMPEEINRIVTDALSDYLFTTEEAGNRNLRNEGVAESKIHFVGHVMIDSLIYFLEKARQSDILERLNLEPRNYALVTLHRPSNVDVKENLIRIIDAFGVIQKDIPIIFPVHPRTQKNIENFGLQSRVDSLKNFKLIPPVGYLDFIQLEQNARLLLTDSGGIQEETTYLQLPCLTLRENTERPVTVELGTNEIVGNDTEKIIGGVEKILANNWKTGKIPPLWDGEAAKRIVDIIE
jgi:UDP-N-acetylglucosamine 2-epimerase (non-hydrolysing)